MKDLTNIQAVGILKLLSTVLLVLNFTVCIAQDSDTSTTSRLLIIGFEKPTYSKAREFVADAWNIQMVRVGGSTVSSHILDSATVHNNSMWKKLDTFLKLDSQKKFEADVSEELRKIVAADKLLESDRKVKRLKRKIENRKGQAFTELQSKKNQNMYVYRVYSKPKNWNGNHTYQKEFDILINLKDQSCKVLN
ncbi:MAG: hypothetical protein COA80_14215 [Leeuwenhoekiella sp.]|nr:MAG: hypothetical protein COA80_14215 [Leeuwenhoekiella sp.]